MNKLSATAIGVALLLVSCDRSYDKVVATWPDGSPHIVQTMKGKEDKAVKIGETRYYENGQKQCEKHYTGEGSRPDGDWSFYYMDGQLFACATFAPRTPTGSNWKFYTPEGNDYDSEGLDSIRVAELGEGETPATVFFYHGDNTVLRQFYSIGTLRAEGSLRKGVKEGVWKFFFSNGAPQVEATFVNGREEGTYIVYHENGTPFYRGMYHEGKRTGTWEVYDKNAELVGKQEY